MPNSFQPNDKSPASVQPVYVATCITHGFFQNLWRTIGDAIFVHIVTSSVYITSMVLRLRIIGACGAQTGTLPTATSYHIGTRALRLGFAIQYKRKFSLPLAYRMKLYANLNLVTWPRMVKFTHSNHLLNFQFLKSIYISYYYKISEKNQQQAQNSCVAIVSLAKLQYMYFIFC